MIKILNKNGELLLSVDVDTLRGANLSGTNLSGANLSCANLSGTDLRGAYLRDTDLSCAYLRGSNLSGADLSCTDLSGSNLSGANLSGANLSGANLIIITWEHWTTYITKDHIRIGCQSHALDKWRGFSDSEIAGMDTRALDFWKINKELIISLCERFEEKAPEKSE